ncbi:MAG: hypothetical protein JWL68_2697 [Actinomycetia bacterium]|nr:hypothetical protein [Actinomycetes bacterium]
MRWSLGIGPFRFYAGRSGASRRAAARRRQKAAEDHRRQRDWQRSAEGQRYHQQAVADLERLNWLDSLRSTGLVTVDKVIPYDNFPNFNVYFTPVDPSCPFREFTTVPDGVPGREHLAVGGEVECRGFTTLSTQRLRGRPGPRG